MEPERRGGIALEDWMHGALSRSSPACFDTEVLLTTKPHRALVCHVAAAMAVLIRSPCDFKPHQECFRSPLDIVYLLRFGLFIPGLCASKYAT